jgi:prepilin signal peptidase PulO-like enzyme (type II secretory pathway)
MFATLLQDLKQPEYIHVLINPLPVYGLLTACLGLVIALVMRSRAAQTATLALIVLTAASAWPVAEYGEQGYDRVLAMADSDGQAWLKAHSHRVDRLIYFFYATAVLAAVAIAAPLKWPRSTPALAIITLVLAFATVGAGAYIAYAGGRIRHREFRNEPPPSVAADAGER